jgi:excisionase family DNA binding protein|tara:strand:- start:172 stop:393 length:222 start_codon:yes stop_codon:yes gene_type:complete
MEYKIVELLKEIKSMIQGKKSEDRWMDIKKTSDYTAVSRSTIRRAVQNGSLKASNTTGKLLFKVSDVERWLNG